MSRFLANFPELINNGESQAGDAKRVHCVLNVFKAPYTCQAAESILRMMEESYDVKRRAKRQGEECMHVDA